jgi:tRNA (Thr-GGU) A37 N-methylase
MSQDCVLTPVAFIHTEFPAKFGIPRQSGLAEGLRGRVVFEEEYRVAEAFRGLEDFLTDSR